jgi:hypothetical protein
LKATHRTREDALLGVTGFNANEDRRHDRRTLSEPELRKLIQVAATGPAYRGMTGADRSICYRLAVATGLRYSEIAEARPESFELGAESPTVTIRAAYTKNGDKATLPLPRDLADDLRPYIAGRALGEPVFDLPDKGVDMLRADLKRAGIAYRDDAGLVYDFHSLRCQLATMADAAGVSPRVVQKLMRHSTLELTGRYTRPRVHDLAGATGSLPSLRPGPKDSEPMAATGTTGPTHQDARISLAPSLIPNPGRTGPEMAAPGRLGESGNDNPRPPEVVGGPGDTSSVLEYRRPDLNRRPAGYESVQAEGQPFDGARLVIHKATVAPFDSQESSPVTASCRLGEASMAPDLAAVVEAWPQLPEAIRAGIVAMVKATRPDDAR